MIFSKGIVNYCDTSLHRQNTKITNYKILSNDTWSRHLTGKQNTVNLVETCCGPLNKLK